MTGPPTRRRPLSLPGDSGPSETQSVCVLNDTPPATGVQGSPRLIAEWLATPDPNSHQSRQLADQEITRQGPLARLAADHVFDHQLALLREYWAAVRHLWLDCPEPLRAARLESDLADFFIDAGMPGLAEIRPIVDGRFEFAKASLTAIIIPAYDTIPGILDANAEAHVEHLVDLVAVDLDRPERHWRRRGEALILGSTYLDIAADYVEPVQVFRNPLTWLKSGGAGIAVLDWNWVPDLLLGFELIAEDVELGERLEAALKPNIWIGRVAA